METEYRKDIEYRQQYEKKKFKKTYINEMFHTLFPLV